MLMYTEPSKHVLSLQCNKMKLQSVLEERVSFSEKHVINEKLEPVLHRPIGL